MEVVIFRETEGQHVEAAPDPAQADELVLEPLVSFVPYMRLRWRLA